MWESWLRLVSMWRRTGIQRAGLKTQTFAVRWPPSSQWCCPGGALGLPRGRSQKPCPTMPIKPSHPGVQSQEPSLGGQCCAHCAREAAPSFPAEPPRWRWRWLWQCEPHATAHSGRDRLRGLTPPGSRRGQDNASTLITGSVLSARRRQTFLLVK